LRDIFIQKILLCDIARDIQVNQVFSGFFLVNAKLGKKKLYCTIYKIKLVMMMLSKLLHVATWRAGAAALLPLCVFVK